MLLSFQASRTNPTDTYVHTTVTENSDPMFRLPIVNDPKLNDYNKWLRRLRLVLTAENTGVPPARAAKPDAASAFRKLLRK